MVGKKKGGGKITKSSIDNMLESKKRYIHKCSVIATIILRISPTVINIHRSPTGINVSLNLFFFLSEEGGEGGGVAVKVQLPKG